MSFGSNDDYTYFNEEWFYVPGPTFNNGGIYHYTVSVPAPQFVYFVPNLYLIYTYSGFSGFGGTPSLNHLFYLPAQIMLYSWVSALYYGTPPWGLYIVGTFTGSVMDADLTNQFQHWLFATPLNPSRGRTYATFFPTSYTTNWYFCFWIWCNPFTGPQPPAQITPNSIKLC